MRFAELLNTPIMIDGQKVILVPDVVGPVSTKEKHEFVEIEAPSENCPAIYARENDIQSAREFHARLPIFGLWQVLIHSEVISLLSELQVVETHDFDGYYLHCENGKALFSGVYESGFFAASTLFSLANATPITPILEELKCPSRQAFLATELRTRNKIETQKNWLGWGAIMAITAILTIITDVSLEQFYQSQNKNLNSKLAEQSRLKNELDTIKKTRLTRLPDDWKKMQQLIQIWQLYPSFSSKTEGNFETGFTFILKNKGYDPSTKFPFLSTRLQQDNTWLARMQ